MSTAPTTERARILIAIAAAKLRASITRTLERDWEVAAVADGAAALAEAQRAPPALVLADAAMPEPGGLELARRLRDDARTRHVPVVVVSARRGDKAGGEEIEAVAADFLAAPFSARELRARVRANLELARARLALGEAHAANRAKDALLSMLGHELRDPLSPILVFLQILRMTEAPAPEVLESMERQVRRLIRVVDSLLDVSELARGTLQLQKARIEVADAVERALALAGPRFAEGGHHLERRVPRGLMLDADPDRLARVLANLVDHAARSSPSGSWIELSAARDGDHVHIDVRHEGPGIAPERIGRVFGLAIARHLVELHGGTIAAHGDGPHQGSVLTVALPAPPAVTASPPSAVSPGRYRILVVDDDAEAALTLRQALQLLGHAVVVAYDGSAALALAEAFGPDVAFLDLTLPGMDGFELARCLWERSSLRLIAVTESGRSADRARTRTAGFEQHLVKPIDLPMLRAALNRRRRGD